jgi:hypothetical protein
MRRIALAVLAVLSVSVGTFACGPLANDGVAPDGGGGGPGPGSDSGSPSQPSNDDSGMPNNTPDTGGGGGDDAGTGDDSTVGDANTPSDAQPSGDTGPGVDSSPPNCTKVTSWSSGAGISHAGWTATASATGSAGAPSDAVTANAFDDNLATRWSNGQAQASANMDHFTVNLGSAQSISQVVLFEGVDAGASDFPATYKVALSTDNMTFTTVATGTGLPNMTAICVPTTTAQYVQITETGTSGSWWSIYELQVFP